MTLRAHLLTPLFHNTLTPAVPCTRRAAGPSGTCSLLSDSGASLTVAEVLDFCDHRECLLCPKLTIRLFHLIINKTKSSHHQGGSPGKKTAETTSFALLRATEEE